MLEVKCKEEWSKVDLRAHLLALAGLTFSDTTRWSTRIPDHLSEIPLVNRTSELVRRRA